MLLSDVMGLVAISMFYLLGIAGLLAVPKKDK